MVVHFDFSFWFWEYVAIYCYLPHEGLHTFLERKQFKVGPFDRYKWSYDPYKWPKTHGYIPGVVILVLGIYRIYEPQNINTIVESMSQKPGFPSWRDAEAQNSQHQILGCWFWE